MEGMGTGRNRAWCTAKNEATEMLTEGDSTARVIVRAHVLDYVRGILKRLCGELTSTKP